MTCDARQHVGQLGDVLFSTAACAMEQVQNNGMSTSLPQGRCCGQPQRHGGVPFHPARDLRLIGGMTVAHERCRRGLPVIARRCEANLTDVKHEHVPGKKVSPPALQRTLAEIDLLPVSLAEHFYVKSAYLIQAGSCHQHAEA